MDINFENALIAADLDTRKTMGINYLDGLNVD